MYLAPLLMMNTETSKDSLVRWLDREATLRIVATDATHTTRALCLLHDLEGETARTFARAVLGGLLLASDLKSFQTLSLQIEIADRVYHIDATGEALVRAMVTRRAHETPVSRLALRRFGQKGMLYQSVVDIPSQDIAGVFEGFVLQSDQQVMRACLECELDPQGLPVGVQGALVRGFPDTPAGALQALIARWDLRVGWKVDDPAAGLDDRTWDRLSHQAVEHHCPCSRERALGSVRALGDVALREAASKGEPMEVVCDFCRSVYSFGPAEFAPESAG
ncbi:MAG: Hsp33 family molecular chaperone HslO [Fibrobacteria bacterium]|nr:Hsp33 family molecular chaperone HslO [Fibrobacteria bacterium]